MKRKKADRILAEAYARGQAMARQQPTADARRAVAKMAPAIGAALATATAEYAARLAAEIADLERQVARIREVQLTAPPPAYGYVDPKSREFVPMPTAVRREVGKGEALASAAAALPADDPRRSELGRAAALSDLLDAPPWHAGTEDRTRRGA